MRSLERQSPCKVNLLLNILARRPDGFHELETVMLPVALFDQLSFERAGRGLSLVCEGANLPTDDSNLVHRAAARFVEAVSARDGLRIRLVKRLPVAAGLGGGSANAGVTLLALNDLFDRPLSGERLRELATELGSDVPFFLQPNPALATGRGERIRPLEPFPALAGAWLLLANPGFGISTAWAYRSLSDYPGALPGQTGRAERLIARLRKNGLAGLDGYLFNSLETPALHKYPILALYQEFLRECGAAAVLMSGSGSTTFALLSGEAEARSARERFVGRFGPNCWTAVLPAGAPNSA